MLLMLTMVNLLMGGILVLRWNSLPPQIPLFYSRPAGEDQLVDVWFILLIPLILNSFVILNTLLLRRYFLGNVLIIKVFKFLNIFLIVALTIIFIKIITLIS